jgi:hypothetical protein
VRATMVFIHEGWAGDFATLCRLMDADDSGRKTTF